MGVVDEDDFEWMAKEKRYIVKVLKHFHENCRSKTPRCRQFSPSLHMENYAFMHHEGLN